MHHAKQGAHIKKELLHGQSASLGNECPISAPAPPQGAPGGSWQLGTPGAGGRPPGRPATASGARASRLQRPLIPPPLPMQELLEKMFKELTILGFVAFSATVLLQAGRHTPQPTRTFPAPVGTHAARIVARAPRTYWTLWAYLLWTTCSSSVAPWYGYYCTYPGGAAHPEPRAAPELRVLSHSHVLDRNRLRQG